MNDKKLILCQISETMNLSTERELHILKDCWASKSVVHDFLNCGQKRLPSNLYKKQRKQEKFPLKTEIFF